MYNYKKGEKMKYHKGCVFSIITILFISVVIFLVNFKDSVFTSEFGEICYALEIKNWHLNEFYSHFGSNSVCDSVYPNGKIDMIFFDKNAQYSVVFYPEPDLRVSSIYIETKGGYNNSKSLLNAIGIKKDQIKKDDERPGLWESFSVEDFEIRAFCKDNWNTIYIGE